MQTPTRCFFTFCLKQLRACFIQIASLLISFIFGSPYFHLLIQLLAPNLPLPLSNPLFFSPFFRPLAKFPCHKLPLSASPLSLPISPISPISQSRPPPLCHNYNDLTSVQIPPSDSLCYFPLPPLPSNMPLSFLSPSRSAP